MVLLTVSLQVPLLVLVLVPVLVMVLGSTIRRRTAATRREALPMQRPRATASTALTARARADTLGTASPVRSTMIGIGT